MIILPWIASTLFSFIIFTMALQILQIKDLPLNNRPRFLGLTASPIKATNAVSARVELSTFLGGFPTQTQILRPALTSSETPHSATSVEWQQVNLSSSQTQLRKKIFDAFKVLVRQYNIDLSPSWIGSPESMSTTIPQIRGTLRNLPSDKWKPGTHYEFKSPKIYSEVCAYFHLGLFTFA